MLRALRRPLVAGLLVVLIMTGFALYVFYGPASRPPAPRSDQALWPGTGPWTTAVLDTLTLEEKVSQLFAADATALARPGTDGYERLAARVERFGVGGIFLPQPSSPAQAAPLNTLQERSALPLLVSQDLEWGAPLQGKGTLHFPPPLAVGATREPALAHAVGYATARRARALGTHPVYTPVATAAPRPPAPLTDVRSFGEEPQLVSRMVGASVQGLQRGWALATAPYIQGDPGWAARLLPFSRRRLDHAAPGPFRAALAAGAQSVTAGRPGADAPGTLPPSLREELGYEGLVVTAPLETTRAGENPDPGEAAVRALEAGADVLLMPRALRAARTAVVQAVETGRLSEDRIDASVERLLRAKEWLGLPGERTVDSAPLPRGGASPSHRVLAGAIARRSLTLLRNEGGLLPILDYARPAPSGAPPPRLLSVALTDAPGLAQGSAFARRLGHHVPDSLLSSHVLGARAQPAEYHAVRAAAKRADLILISLFQNQRDGSGRSPLSTEHRRLVRRLLDAEPPVVLTAFGPPALAHDLRRPADAHLVAYGASNASQDAVVAALFGRSRISGTLPVALPEAYEYGAGLDAPQVALRHGLPEAVGMRSSRLQRVDSLMHVAIENRAFPGGAVAIGRGPATALLKGYGSYTYEGDRPVTPRSAFDLASLTKVVATTTAAMQLYEAGRLKLDARVARYLPAFAQSDKEAVTIRQLLTHSAGLPPFRLYAGMDFANRRAEGTRQALLDTLLAEPLQYEPGTRSEYSDLGMVAMGLVIEAITGQSLAAYAEEHIFEPLGMEQTGFRPIAATDPDTAFVPTEREGFRGRLLQGEVHDPTAYLLGGVAGHAGVFSTARDLATFAYMLIHGGRIYGRQFLQQETIERFTERAKGLGGDNTRALGWDTKTMNGYSSAGAHFGPNSFGHTGFTGTSLWIDPDANLFVLLLTNRVYPKRKTAPQIIDIRPQLADLAHTAIAGPPAPLLPPLPQLAAEANKTIGRP